MNKLFKKALYNISRPNAKKYLTNNLGKVVEDDEKITCYVKKNKIKLSDYNYTISCSGITEKKKEIAKEVVKFTEQVYKTLQGKEKLEKAMEAMSQMLAEKGIHITALEMQVLLEAAVAEFNKAFEKKDTTVTE